MNYKEIIDLLKFINKTEISEFKLKEGDFEMTIRTKEYHKGKPAPSASQQVISVPNPNVAAIPNYTSTPTVEQPAGNGASQSSVAKEAPKDTAAEYVQIKSPIVGTFYRSASPEKPPYLKVGDRVGVGDIVCIVEAMKLFNEIESEVSGTVVKVLIEDASPCEYDQVLFLVDPNG